MSGLTERLAWWSGNVREGDVPEQVLDFAGLRVLDSIGVAFAGRNEPGVDALLRHAADSHGPQGAPVFGHARSVSAYDAALVNGWMAHVLDFDDSVLPSGVHLSGGLTAGLLAIGHLLNSAGSDVLRGFVAGFEVGVRLADALHPAIGRAGWHKTGVLTPLAVAVGGCVMQSAGHVVLEHALGIAASQSGGLISNRGSMTKAMHTGHGAWVGVTSALLAMDGFTSSRGSLDDEPGGKFMQVFGGSSLDVAIESLGREWSVLRSAIKPYACGVVGHAVIDGAIALHKELGNGGTSDIEKVVVHASTQAVSRAGASLPEGGVEAKWSLPFMVAGPLVYGHASPALFSDEVVNDIETRRLIGLVEVIGEPEFSQEQAVVSIHTKSGQNLTKRIEAALGSTGNPMGEDSIRTKFAQNMASQGETDQGRRIDRAVLNLSNHPIREVTTLL